MKLVPRRPLLEAAILGALLLLALAAAYRPALSGGFVWDDDFYVTRNPLLTAPDGLRRIWFSADSPSQYFPLVYTVFRWQRSLWGSDPFGYHLVNLVLHAANALLLWRVLHVLRLPGAFLGAALWALHPVQVESVAWISELKNVLSTFLVLLSSLAWLGREGAGRRRPALYALSLLLFVLALTAKTTAAVLPALLLVVAWFRGERPRRPLLLELAPFAAAGLAMGSLTVWWERHQVGTAGAFFDFSPAERPLIAGRALWFYLGKLALPLRLAFSYPRWTLDARDPLSYLWPAAFLALLFVLWHRRGFLGRAPFAAAAFFAAALLPLLGFFSLYTFKYAFVADHYQYLAAAGPLALAASAGTVFSRGTAARRALGAALFIGVLAVLGLLTWRQAGAYRNGETLWGDAIAKYPDRSWMARNNLGTHLAALGRNDEALSSYRASLPGNPDPALPYLNMGLVLAKLGRFAEAEDDLRRSIRHNPLEPKASYNLGLVLAARGRPAEAEVAYLEALRLAPGMAEAEAGLGLALERRGRLEEAARHLARAQALGHETAIDDYVLGGIYLRLGRPGEAALQYRRSLALAPGLAEARRRLAEAEAMLGR